jgi:nucleotide-binding universal stress UspA family protein
MVGNINRSSPTMKTILLPVEANSAIEGAFATAGLLANRFSARVDCVALRPSIVDFIAPDPVVVVLPQGGYSETDSLQAARDRFDTLSRKSPGGPDVFRWSGRPPIDDAGLSLLSRVYDVTVVGRPGVGRNEPRMTTLEAALFESGRPVLMAPPNVPRSVGSNVLVHWNASTETARIVFDALPILKLAEVVTLLSVEGNMVPGPKPEDMIDYLAAHGIKSTAVFIKPATKAGAGEAILVEARKQGADLILKGAYTQSRLKQMIFGGATQHMLQASDIPVLFSH